MSHKNWDKDRAAELLAQGKTSKQIAEEIGVSIATVGRWRAGLAKTQIPPKEPPAAIPAEPPQTVPESDTETPHFCTVRIETEIGEISLRAATGEAALALAEGLVTHTAGEST